MSFLYISDVYASIHRVLREDEIIRELMGFTEDTPPEEFALRIQKRMKPVDLVADNFPMISFYKLPGFRGHNHMTYSTAFDFDIYTNDDVETAIDIADRVNELFDDQFLPLCKGISFKGQYVTSGEDVTDLNNTYKYYTQILFNLGIEG